MNKDAGCSIVDVANKIDKLIENSSIPHIFNRRIDSILNHTKWKCSQVKLFFFYLAIPALIKNLDNEYFVLLCGYICVMRILYEPIMNITDIDLAEKLLNEYYESIGTYFGISAYDYTVHAHIHLAEQVRNHVPLHCHSQFAFEGALNNIRLMISGSKGYLNQIIHQLTVSRYLDHELSHHEFQAADLENLIENKRLNNQGLVDPKLKSLTSEERQILEKQTGTN